MVKINKEKCTGCGICANICPEGIEMVDGKAEIKNENVDCLKNAADACPRNAIVLDGENEQDREVREIGRTSFNQGFGQGRGIGKGIGRGLGVGPRDGRGKGSGKGSGGGRGRW